MMTSFNCDEMIIVKIEDLLSYLLYSAWINRFDTRLDSKHGTEYGKIDISGRVIRVNGEEYNYSSNYPKDYSFNFKIERLMSKELKVKKAHVDYDITLKKFNGYIISLNDLKRDKENKSINTDPDIKIYISDVGIVVERCCTSEYHKMMEERIYLDMVDYDIDFKEE